APGFERPRFTAGASSTDASAVLIVPIAELPLGELSAFLSLDAQRRDRTGLEPAETDLVACLFAIAVGAVLDPHQRGVDLLQQLPFTVARAQLETELRLLRGAIVRVGEVRRLVLHVEHGAI